MAFNHVVVGSIPTDGDISKTLKLLHSSDNLHPYLFSFLDPRFFHVWLQEITRASFPFVLSFFLNPNFVVSYMTWSWSFSGFGVPLHLASRLCGVSALEAQAICSLSCFRSGLLF